MDRLHNNPSRVSTEVLSIQANYLHELALENMRKQHELGQLSYEALKQAEAWKFDDETVYRWRRHIVPARAGMVIHSHPLAKQGDMHSQSDLRAILHAIEILATGLFDAGALQGRNRGWGRQCLQQALATPQWSRRMPQW